MRRLLFAATTVMLVCGASAPTFAQAPVQGQEPTHDVNTLAKETQNPVGSLTSVPFQFNFNTGATS